MWNDISKQFISEKVWITDVQMRSGFTLEGNGKSDPVMNESFDTANYGNTAMMGGDGKDVADSVRIKGLHLDKQTEVIDIVVRLRGSQFLSFEWEGEKIPDSRIITDIMAAPSAENNDYAAPFELLIPLKNPIQLK